MERKKTGLLDRLLSSKGVNLLEIVLSVGFILYELYVLVFRGGTWLTVVLLVFWICIGVWSFVQLRQELRAARRAARRRAMLDETERE